MKRVLLSPWSCLAAGIGITLLHEASRGWATMRHTALLLAVGLLGSVTLWWGLGKVGCDLLRSGHRRLGSSLSRVGLWEVVGILLVTDMLVGILLHPLYPIVIDLGPTVLALLIAGSISLLQQKFAGRQQLEQ